MIQPTKGSQEIQLRHHWDQSWPELARAIVQPEACAGLDEGAFVTLVGLLKANALLPAFLAGLRRHGAFQRLPESIRARLLSEDAQYWNASEKLWQELECVLGWWAKEGLEPCLLKGAHLALAYYEERHQRPMGDVDVLFKDLARADRAFSLLEARGYKRLEAAQLGEDIWAYGLHLPPLGNERTGFVVEVHGSLIYSPKDRRYKRVECLIDSMEPLEFKGLKVWGLCPEANIVYLLVHNFHQHAHDPPKLQPVLDVARILTTERQRLNFGRLCDLAERTAFPGAVAEGLQYAQDLFGAMVSEDTLDQLKKAAADEGRRTDWEPGRKQGRETRVFESVLQSNSIPVASKLLFYRLCPKVPYLRFLYPELAHRPAVVLYLHRWSDVFRRLFLLMIAWSKRQR